MRFDILTVVLVKIRVLMGYYFMLTGTLLVGLTLEDGGPYTPLKHL